MAETPTNILQPLEPLEAPQTILVIVAHHDDIEFGMAGSVSKWVKAGHSVHYVVITDGSAGSNEPGINPAELAETRRIEQLNAAQAVGVEDVRFLGHADGTLQATLQLRLDLTRIMRELKPYRVVCQDPTTVFVGDGYVNHPDHRAAGEAAIYATFPSSESRPIFRGLLHEGYEPHKVSELLLVLTNNPTHYEDVTATMEDKLNALRHHISQIGESEIADDGALKFVTEMTAEMGQQVGVGYAEMYKVMTLQRANDNAVNQHSEQAQPADKMQGG
jgi:LmbE family N-acetylglucosaminyl deacetylase